MSLAAQPQLLIHKQLFLKFRTEPRSALTFLQTVRYAKKHFPWFKSTQGPNGVVYDKASATLYAESALKSKRQKSSAENICPSVQKRGARNKHPTKHLEFDLY